MGDITDMCPAPAVDTAAESKPSQDQLRAGSLVDGSCSPNPTHRLTETSRSAGRNQDPAPK
ncbi:hypothetical protein [Arthrobacter rhizosphaerae]|uniref:hypothetical protein n=1 Tax=Arthrobacter rhizosphaerae TaxID=2855490 RepID=UPI001FF44EA5|nr:hypothetical protein [Arthrobacter rhizosphaerae]